MDPFGMTPEQYTAGATIVMAAAAAATFFIVWRTAEYAREQVHEAKHLRLQQSRPHVVVYIGVEQRELFMLVVENVGNTAAHNVRIEFDNPPQSVMRGFDDLRMLHEPIPTMPPRHRYRAYWDMATNVFEEDDSYPHPLSYSATVSYEDGQGRPFEPEQFILDFRIFEGQATGPMGVTELVKAVEGVGKQHKRWTEEGLIVRTRDGDAEDRVRYRPFRIRRALRAWDDGGLREVARWYTKDLSRRRGLYEQPGRRKR